MNLINLAKIRAWYEQPNGCWVLNQEQQLLEQIWEQCFGYYLVQLGLTPHTDQLIKNARQCYRFALTPFLTTTDFKSGNIIGDFMQIPLATDSVDVVLVHHWLGLYGNPMQALHEIYRILMPEGRVIICGIHPAWMWPVYDKICGELNFPWSLSSAPVWQVKKWLDDVGFSAGSVIRHSQGLSLQKNKMLPKTSLWFQGLRQLARWNLPIGGGYIMVAHKRVSTLTPLRLEWSMQETWASYRKLPEKNGRTMYTNR